MSKINWKKYLETREVSPTRTIWGVEIGENSAYKTAAEAFASKLQHFQWQIFLAGEDTAKQQELFQERDNFLASYKEELLPEESAEDLLKSALEYNQAFIAKTLDSPYFSEVQFNEAYTQAGMLLYSYNEVSTIIADTLEKEPKGTKSMSKINWEKYMETREVSPTRTIWGVEIGENSAHKTAAEAFASKLQYYSYELYLAEEKNDVERLNQLTQEKTNFLENFHKELLPEESVQDLLISALEFNNAFVEKCFRETTYKTSGMNIPISKKNDMLLGCWSEVSDEIEAMLPGAEFVDYSNDH